MKELDRLILIAQKYEITERKIYERLIPFAKTPKNKETLKALSDGSLKHYNYWEKITGQKINSDKLKVLFYSLIFRLFGLTFSIKLMEASEKKAEELIEKLDRYNHEYTWIIQEEKQHEKKVVELIDEDFLQYISSAVLGANDALVSTTGTAAGLSFALHNAKLIGVTSLIAGATAALSMGSSEFLSTTSEKSSRNAVKSGLFTFVTYVLTVTCLIIPYFLAKSHYLAFGITLCLATVIITLFSFYISVIMGISFRKRFLQNIVLSFGIALISFGIGVLMHTFFNLDV